jgi:hypothetical protein
MDDNRERAPGTVASGQSCQLCGVATPSDEPLCDSCSNPADAIADTPLPPIPDGGLSRAMPAWLRSSPDATAEQPQSSHPAPNEFASILSDEDIPDWLKRMAERHSTEQTRAAGEPKIPASAPDPVQVASPTLESPTTTPTGVSENRVMVGAEPPRPVDRPPSTSPRSLKSRLPAVENRTALGVSILAAIATVVILAVILFG